MLSILLSLTLVSSVAYSGSDNVKINKGISKGGMYGTPAEKRAAMPIIVPNPPKQTEDGSTESPASKRAAMPIIVPNPPKQTEDGSTESPASKRAAMPIIVPNPPKQTEDGSIESPASKRAAMPIIVPDPPKKHSSEEYKALIPEDEGIHRVPPPVQKKNKQSSSPYQSIMKSLGRE